MMCLKQLKLDGIAYYSNQIQLSHQDLGYDLTVNLALPIFESHSNTNYGNICKYCSITKPVNFVEFKKSMSDSTNDSDLFLKNLNPVSTSTNEKSSCSYGADLNIKKYYAKSTFSHFDTSLRQQEHTGIIDLLKSTP